MTAKEKALAATRAGNDDSKHGAMCFDLPCCNYTRVGPGVQGEGPHGFRDR
jgi:hypothetical protein